MRLVRLQTLLENLRGSFWLVPGLAVVLALAAGLVLPRVAVASEGALASYVFNGGAEGARGVLQAIAGSVITVTSLTFSLTIVTLQLASSQFSPRLLRTFLRDLRNQTVLGILLATFVYSLTVLRTVRTGDSEVENAVPQLAVTVAFVLVVASVSALVWFIQHSVGVIRVDTMMTDVRAETAGVIDEIYPADQDRDDGSPDAGARAEDVLPPPVPSDAGSVLAPTSGFLLAVDTEALCSWAAEHGVVVAVDAEPGTWLLRGGPWARVWSEDPSAPLDDVAEHLRSRVAIGNERTTQQDARHGVSQLVDIAAKSLSPGINDPTTAVHAVGHLGDLLATLAGRRLGALIVRDEGEALRVVVARATFADYLELAFGQVRRYGAGEPAVVHAVLDVLAGLAGQVRGPERRDALRDQLSALAADARRSTPSAHDLSRVEEHVARVELLLIGALST
jgi:uncharacterized membrane protein